MELPEKKLSDAELDIMLAIWPMPSTGLTRWCG